MILGERLRSKIVPSLTQRDRLPVRRPGLCAMARFGLQRSDLNQRLHEKIGYLRLFKDASRLGCVGAGA